MRDIPRRTVAPLANVIRFLLKDKTELVIFFTAFLVEIAFGFYLLYKWGHTFACGDAVSHLYIPRTIFDNRPFNNFANLGTVWLPMFHLLVMPLTLIDLLYTTGFAGTIINSLVTGGICVVLYRLIGEKKLGILASALFMCNAFTLTYGVTPMMEQTAIFFAVLATYYFKRYWEKDDTVEFMKCSLALILGTLTRYEVWAVAFLIIFFFTLRELRNGQSYRVAYAHLPLWGIFSWLFWNLAIFRDPLMFIHHPLSAQVGAIRAPRYFAGSIWLTADLVFNNVTAISGMLCLLAVLSTLILLTQKKLPYATSTMLLLSPIFFHWYFMFAQGTASWMRFFYIGFAGVVVSSFWFAKEFKKKLRVIAIITILALYFLTTLSHPVVLTTGIINGASSDINFPDVSKLKAELEAIREVIGDQNPILISTRQSGLFPVLTGTSPSKVFDDYDFPAYLEIMEEPWKHCSFVVIEKTSPDDPELKSINDYYEEKHFIYRYYNDIEWRSTFLQHYELVLETKHCLLFRLVERLTQTQMDQPHRF